MVGTCLYIVTDNAIIVLIDLHLVDLTLKCSIYEGLNANVLLHSCSKTNCCVVLTIADDNNNPGLGCTLLCDYDDHVFDDNYCCDDNNYDNNDNAPF